MSCIGGFFVGHAVEKGPSSQGRPCSQSTPTCTSGMPRKTVAMRCSGAGDDAITRLSASNYVLCSVNCDTLWHVHRAAFRLWLIGVPVYRLYPPPPLAHARPCLSTGWALNRRFEEILGPLFLWSRMEDWVSVERLYRERGAHSCL